MGLFDSKVIDLTFTDIVVFHAMPTRVKLFY